MTRITTMIVAASLAIAPFAAASAQTTAPAPSGKMKLTKQSLKEMKAKWGANKAKLKACRQDVKAKGLAGDDRWFYIEECMGKS